MPRLPEQLDICFRKNGSATLTLSGDDALALATQLVASAVRIDDHSVVLEPLRFRADKDATSQLVHIHLYAFFLLFYGGLFGSVPHHCRR